MEEDLEIKKTPKEKIIKEREISSIFPQILILPGRKSLMETAKMAAVVKKTPTVVFISLTQRGVKVLTVETPKPRRDVRRRIIGNPSFFRGSKKPPLPILSFCFKSGIPKRRKIVTKEIIKAKQKK